MADPCSLDRPCAVRNPEHLVEFAVCYVRQGGSIAVFGPRYNRQDHKTGVQRIAAERQRQIDVEGYTAEHDTEHGPHDLITAAYCYMLASQAPSVVARGERLRQDVPPSMWPWDRSSWKPSDDPIRNLEKAAALLAADIDRRLVTDLVTDADA